MSHFEKVGVIFITGLVAIILALSLFGSGKQDPESTMAFKDSAPRVTPPTAQKSPPVRRAPDAVVNEKNKALWDAISAGPSKTTARPVPVLNSKDEVTPVVPLSQAIDSSAARDGRESNLIADVKGVRSNKKSADGPAIDSAPNGDTEHVIASGENYYSLARRFYHDPSKWQLIAKRNKIPSERLRAGTKIVIPPLPMKAAPASEDDAALESNSDRVASSPIPRKTSAPGSEAPSDGRVRAYKVRKGDTLSQIAQSQLGTVKLLAKLEEANRDVLKDHSIREGMTLRIPATTP